MDLLTMKHTLTLLTALLLAPLTALCADDSKPSGVRLNNFELPVVLANPGAEFQDDVRSGAMINGMDRTPGASGAVPFGLVLAW
jgi:hypothetical protein